MALNFNVDPYYDDFDAAKNFHRILFKPGFAVQARELTQSQTILQDQISKFGNGIYNDGSKVSGANITYDTNIVTGKLTSSAADNIESFVGLYAVGATSKFVAFVSSVDIVNYYIVTKPTNINNNKSFASGETVNFYNTKVDALSSLSASVTPTYTATAITESTSTKTGVSGTYLDNKLTGSNIASGVTVGDIVTIASAGDFTAVVIKVVNIDTLLISKNLPQNLASVNISVKTVVSSPSMQFSIDEGVWFTNGFFVRNDKSSIVPDPLNPLPSAIIGFEVNENIIDSFNDSSLLDPAIAASNYQAPGADRYKISFSLVSRPYVSNQAIANLTTSKFIELVRVRNGVVENVNNTPIYSELSKYIAQRIYDQSGDFIVNPYKLVINDSSPNETFFSASITAGKAYINGNLVEQIAPTQYKVEKSRDTSSLDNQNIATYYGNYVEAKNLRGSIINFQSGTQVQLHNVAFGAANSNTVIGTASVFSLDYDSGTNNNAVYKLFLSEVSLANNEFANVSSLIVPGAGNNYSSVSFSANTVSPTTLNDALYDDLLFPLPQVNLANVTNVNYVTKRYYNAASFVNGVFTINTNGPNEIFVGGSGSISAAERRINYGVVVTSSSGNYTAGTFIPMDQANVTITISNSPGTPQATVNIAGGFNGSGTIVATISSTSAPVKNKVLNTNGYSVVSANTLNAPIELTHADIYQLNGVYELGNTISFIGAWGSGNTYSNTQSVIYGGKVYRSLTNSNSGNTPNTSANNWLQLRNSSANYAFDNGQKDNMYDHGTVANISKVAKGNIVVVYDYFTHSGGTGYLTLDSYPVSYSLIPNFTSKKYGTTVNLRDCIDFRPRRSDGIGTKTFDTFELVAPFNEPFVDYAYYLNRIDKIVLYPNGQFKTLRGISSYENPTPPSDIPGSLTLFKLDIPAYTFSAQDVMNTPTVLRRYTMRDIGVLDKRISNLEYYTSLSLLEKQVMGMDVTDATGQNILFKNGFLVDGFSGSGVADVQNPDYAASIDKFGQIARPLFSSYVADYSTDVNQGTFKLTDGKENNKLFLSNNVVTFSYTETPLVFQNVASQIVNVNPFNVVNFIGDAAITPSSDVWYDTKSKPIINVVNQDQSAWIAAVNGTGNGSQWNDWQINWTGQSSDVIINNNDTSAIARDTQAISDVIASKGLQAAVTGGPVQVSSTTKIISSEVVPIARSVPVRFDLRGMAPFTRLNVFINGAPINRYVTADAPTGVYKVDITNAGSGYTNGNNQSIITVTGNCQVPAVLTANVSGGQVVGVTIVNPGFGYADAPTISVTGANTTTALLASNTTNFGTGTPLVTDINGSVSGTIMIPSDSILKFPSGALNIEWSDNLLNPALSKSYAKTTFYSQGYLNLTETTVVSTRPPIVTAKPQTSTKVTTPAVVTVEDPPQVVNPDPGTGTPSILAYVDAFNDGSGSDKIIIGLDSVFYSNNPGTYFWTIEGASTNFSNIRGAASATSGTFNNIQQSAIITLGNHSSSVITVRVSGGGFNDWVGSIGLNEKEAPVVTLDSPLTVTGWPATAIINQRGQLTNGKIRVTNTSGQSITVLGTNISRPSSGQAGLFTVGGQNITLGPFESIEYDFNVSSPENFGSFTFGFTALGYPGTYPTFTVNQAGVFDTGVTTITNSGTDTSNTSTATFGNVIITQTTTTIDDVVASSVSSNTVSDITSVTTFTTPTTAVTDVVYNWANGLTDATSQIKTVIPNGQYSTTLMEQMTYYTVDNLSGLYNSFTSIAGKPPTFNEFVEIGRTTAHDIMVSGAANTATIITNIENQIKQSSEDTNVSAGVGGGRGYLDTTSLV